MNLKRSWPRVRASRRVLIAGIMSIIAVNASAQVNWLDPLQYQKPAFVPVSMPDEASTPYKYYVDLSNGSGSTCSSASPCGSLDSLIGKPGMSGGPAYVYIRGTGGVSLYNDTFYGSAGNEIVIKPWGATVATITANSNMNSTGVHHVIWDGGPNLGIAFTSAGGDLYNFHVIADNITFYRIRAYATAGGSMLFAVGDNRVVNNVRFINSEFYGCNAAAGYQCSAIYVGPGSGGGYSTMLIQGSIIRDMGGEGIEVNPRVTSSGMTIIGNAFHNIGKQTCSGNWQCRPGITMSVQSGGGNNGTVIANNLIWDTGSGCIWDRGGGAPRPAIYQNTCFDYGKGSSGGGPNPQGISGYSNGGTAVVQNNIIYAPNGTSPFDGSAFPASNNLCGSGASCGSAKQTWSINTVLSTDQNTSNFLQLAGASEARNSGLAISAVTVDYAGKPRPPYDIGANAYGTNPSGALQPPSNVRVISP